MEDKKSTRLKILLVEDNPGDVRLIQELLADVTAVRISATKFDLTHVETLAAGETYLKNNKPDVILLDLSLPDSHGLSTFTHFYPLTFNIPVIVLTGLNDEFLAVEAMQQGAQDYLAKGDVNSRSLIRAIRYAIERQRLVTELSQKAEELVARNVELDAFSHTMAHQVRGPLSQIIGYAEYLGVSYKEKLDIELRQILNRILQSGHKMNNIMSELLLLASVRSKELVELNPLDMSRIVSEAYKRLRFQVEESHGHIYIPDLWPVAHGYGPWIEEVWVNYISNALKYGGTPPELALGATVQSNGMVQFWIKDNGQGIAPNDQRNLFKPYTRLTEIQVQGEGLGLSIVQRIIRKCGGEVGVQSQLGNGSTFWFTLPSTPLNLQSNHHT